MDIPLFQALTRAGVPDEHAKATTEAIRTEIKQQVSDRTEHLATREDLAAFRHSMQTDIQTMRADLIDRMASMHRWTLGTTLSLMALMVAAMRIWPPH